MRENSLTLAEGPGAWRHKRKRRRLSKGLSFILCPSHSEVLFKIKASYPKFVSVSAEFFSSLFHARSLQTILSGLCLIPPS